MACSPLLSDEDLKRFRTKPCRRRQMGLFCDFGPDRCQYSHCVEWSRRCPFYLCNSNYLRYLPEKCPEVALKEDTNDTLFKTIGVIVSNECKRGGACPFAHSVEEILYHPLLYKTIMCQDYIMGKCETYYCPFMHGTAEERVFLNKKYYLPFHLKVFENTSYPNVEFTEKIEGASSRNAESKATAVRKPESRTRRSSLEICRNEFRDTIKNVLNTPSSFGLEIDESSFTSLINRIPSHVPPFSKSPSIPPHQTVSSLVASKNIRSDAMKVNSSEDSNADELSNKNHDWIENWILKNFDLGCMDDTECLSAKKCKDIFKEIEEPVSKSHSDSGIKSDPTEEMSKTVSSFCSTSDTMVFPYSPPIQKNNSEKAPGWRTLTNNNREEKLGFSKSSCNGITRNCTIPPLGDKDLVKTEKKSLLTDTVDKKMKDLICNCNNLIDVPIKEADENDLKFILDQINYLNMFITKFCDDKRRIPQKSRQQTSY